MIEKIPYFASEEKKRCNVLI